MTSPPIPQDGERMSARDAMTDKQRDAVVRLFGAYDRMIRSLIRQRYDMQRLRAGAVVRLLNSGMTEDEVAGRLGIGPGRVHSMAAWERREAAR